MNTSHTMTVAQLIAALQQMPPDLPVEILNHYTSDLSWVDAVDLFDGTCASYSPDDGDYPCVVIRTETWAYNKHMDNKVRG